MSGQDQTRLLKKRIDIFCFYSVLMFSKLLTLACFYCYCYNGSSKLNYI